MEGYTTHTFFVPFEYRQRYAADQLGQLNRIMALKDLGFSLEQTHKMLSGVTIEELRGMLALRRAQLVVFAYQAGLVTPKRREQD